MADFNTAVKKTLINEGGYTNNPNDPGGATKYGILQRDMPSVNIADITEAQATAYYSEHYWKALYSQIESQDIADKLFDSGVLFGVGEAVKVLQITLQPAFPAIVADSEFGEETLSAINQSDSPTLLQGYKTSLVAYMLRIVVNKPVLREFTPGWLKRINS
jgi:lysozyme family protein